MRMRGKIETSPLTQGNDSVPFTRMAVTKVKARPVKRRLQNHDQLSGRELALLLKKLNAAKSPQERKRWRREFMRGFYGDTRADSYVLKSGGQMAWLKPGGSYGHVV